MQNKAVAIPTDDPNVATLVLVPQPVARTTLAPVICQNGQVLAAGQTRTDSVATEQMAESSSLLDGLDEGDWNDLHDAVLAACGDSLPRDRLLLIFAALPAEVRALAEEWGFLDTEVRDAIARTLSQR